MLKIFFLICLIQLGYINCDQVLYGQCGGKGFTGPTKCPPNSYCQFSNDYYSQCVPGNNGGGGDQNPNTKTTGGTQTTRSPISNGKFPGCTFKWGRNWPDDVFPLENRKKIDYSQYDYVTKWIGVNWCTGKPSCTDFDDDQRLYLEMIKSTGKIPVMYGYVIAFEAHNLHISDCDMGDINQSLCKKGANHIRQNKARIIERYSMHAGKVAEYLGKQATAVFLIEPDFYQYYRKDGSHGVQQDGGPLSGQEARALFDGIAQAIKAALPNALISWDISPWAEDMETWWGFFKTSPYINFIHTSGGQARGDTATIKDNNRATWAGMKQLTGKPIFADSGYGVGGKADPSRNGPWYLNSNVDARIRDGVIAETLGFSNRVPTYRNAKTC